MEEKTRSLKKVPDVAKETLSFLRTIDVARLREYDLQTLLQYELTSCSFYMTKDGNLRKFTKADLAKELKQSLEKIPIDVAPSDMDSVIIFDFMAFSRRVPVKKLKLPLKICSNISLELLIIIQPTPTESTLFFIHT